MPGCAFGLCGRVNVEQPEPGLVLGSKLRDNWLPEQLRDRYICYLCYVLPLRFPKLVACGKPAGDKNDCVLVKGHRPPCRGESRAEKVDTSTRDGDPKLAAERERRHPMWEKRKRVGPHR